MAKDVESITLGIGDLSIDNDDVGYLGGEVIFTANIEHTDFKVGVPMRTIKRVVLSFDASLKASLAQIDATSIYRVLGVGRVSPNGQRITFGDQWALPELTNVKFVHTRPNGETITIVFPKAQIEPGNNELKFSNESYTVQSLTITANYDGTSASYPYIEFGV